MDLSELLPLTGALIAGTCLGFVMGLVPGLGGRIGIILCMPLAIAWDPAGAAIFLFSMHAVVHTASSIPAIAFGVPTTAADAATVIDGFPLARMGRAGEALGASLSASAFGGVVGALAFMLAIPVARPLVTSFGPPEFLLLSLFGITMLATISREGILQGFVVAALGVLCAMVGYDVKTNEPRLAFGILELWDGLDLAPLVAGMFVIPEMLSGKPLRDAESFERAITTSVRDVLRGMSVTFRHWSVLLHGTFLGIWVGAMPAVGSSIAVWMSYGHAARTAKSEIPFGQGAIAGVIAPEAANNSKEGGAMIPTLFFGIPGSSAMAIMMAALTFAGVAVGPSMLTSNVGLSYALGIAVILANLIAIPVFFLVVPLIVRLSALRRESLVPFAIAIAVTSALIRAPNYFTHVQLLIASALGLALKAANWPRAPFILGFVIGGLVETSAYQTWVLWGWSALARPITFALTLALLGWLAYAVRRRPMVQFAGPREANIVLAGLLAAMFAAAMLAAWPLPAAGGLPVLAVCGVGIAMTAAIAALAYRTDGASASEEKIRHLGWFGLFLAATPVIGLPASTFLFVERMLAAIGIRRTVTFASAILFVAVQLAFLSLVLDVAIEKEILGRALWAALGY
jgi:TctA family transporter